MKLTNNKEAIFYHIERMAELTKRKDELKPTFYKKKMAEHMDKIAKLSE